jgi:BMFP domain-containing protein YqiC
MTQTSNRFYDQFARLMNDAAGVAQGVRREATNLVRSQAERFLNDMDLVRREDFDAVREMASLAREENVKLHARIDSLEAQLKSAGMRPWAGAVDVAATTAPVPVAAAKTTRPRRSRTTAGSGGSAESKDEPAADKS